MSPRTIAITTGRTATIVRLSVAAGVSLLLVLPLGISSVLHPLIPIVWYLHLGLLLIAATLTLTSLGALVQRCGWSRFGVLAGFIILSGAVTALGTLPVVDPRALDIHLAVPKRWLGAGAIEPNLWDPRSLYPGLAELAYLEFIHHDATHLISLYLFVCTVITAGLIARFIEYRTHRPEGALIGAILALTVPALIRATTELAPEVLTSLFVTATLIFLTARLDGDRRRGVTFMAGASLGLAAATTPSGLLALPAIILAYGIAARRADHPLRRRFGEYVALGLGVLVLFSPWVIRNGWWIANPFFPLGGDLLGSNALLAGDGWRLDLWGSFRNLSADPVALCLGPLEALLVARDDPTSRFDGVATPLFTFAALALWSYRRHPWVVFCGFFALAVYLCSGFFGRLALRDLTTILMPLVSLTVLGLGRFALFFKRRLERRVVAILVAAHVVFVAFYLVERVRQTGAIAYRRAGTPPTDYLAARLPAYPMIEFINRNVAPEKYVLSLFGGGALYYYSPRVVTGGTSPTGHLPAWLRTAQTGRAVAREFSARGIDLLVADETALEAALREAVSDRELALWADFLANYTTVRHTAGTLTLRYIPDPRRGDTSP